jgi:hypothetical protein
MAVRTVRLAGVTRTVNVNPKAEIKYVQDGQVWVATKLSPAEFDDTHRQALLTAYFTPERELVFGTPGWRSCWVGAGEEKVVYLVIDAHDRAFALEVLAKDSYLEGRLVEGHYFGEFCAPHLVNHRWDTRSLHGHIFSGIVKAREFIYGDTLAGPGLHTPPVISSNIFYRVIGGLSKYWSHMVVGPRYMSIKRIYRDAHEANVAVELIPLHNPEKKKHYLFPLLWLEEDGRLHWRYYRLTPIDVRVR